MHKLRRPRQVATVYLSIWAIAILTLPTIPLYGQEAVPTPASTVTEQPTRMRPIQLVFPAEGAASRSYPGILERLWPAASIGHAFGVAPYGADTNSAADTSTAKATFATNFPLVEDPISEGGVWHHLGRSWKFVRTVANHAIGTQTGSGGYDDSYAYLSGFAPDQTAQATLWIDPAAKGDYREVELLLHWADSPTSARGYECNLAWNGAYAEIVRWNGPYGDFTYITKQTAFDRGIMPPRSGDLFKATISGSTIRVYLNKNDGKGYRLIVAGSDGTFVDGNPGMGFFIQGSRDPAQVGFSDYAASSN